MFLGDLLIFTCGKILGSDEGIKLGLSDGGFIVTILVNVYGITLGVYFGTYIGSSNG